MSSNSKAMELYNLAGEEYFKGRWGEAKKLLEEAIEYDPNFAVAYRNLGIIFHDLGQANESAKNLIKARELKDTMTSELYRMLGDSHFMIGEYNDAIAFLKEAIKLDEKNVNARYWLALCYIELSKLKKDPSIKDYAKEQIEKIRKTNPKIADQLEFRL